MASTKGEAFPETGPPQPPEKDESGPWGNPPPWSRSGETIGDTRTPGRSPDTRSNPCETEADTPMHTRWMSRTDGCPSCIANTEPPQSVTPTEDGFSACYRCTDCGHEWTTSWRS